MPSRRDLSYENEHYRRYEEYFEDRKPRRPNKNFLITLHVFIALVLLDCIAEQQQKRSRRLYEASSKPRDRRTKNPVVVVRKPSSCRFKKPPSKESSVKLTRVRPQTRPLASPALPQLAPSQFQDSKDLSVAEHKLLKRKLAEAAESSDIPKGKSWAAGIVPENWKVELTRLFAWMPLDTMEELLEVVMEVISEASDVI